MATHEVRNQPPELGPYNAFTPDPVLAAGIERAAPWSREHLAAFGERIGSEEVRRWGFEANENPPVLHTHDRFGHRRDEVLFHPAYHALMRLSLEAGVHSLPWEDPRPGAHVARAGLLYLATQAEAGHTCPVSMTYAAVPALRAEPAVAAEWEPRLVRRAYDPSFQPAERKAGVTVGMAMTEKQGGSDVRANTTRAGRAADGTYRITGHKWFCSAPMCDAFLVLAQAPGGLTCFLVPRWTPEGAKNGLYFQRLKNKLGNRANASSEVEYEDAWAQRIGEEGRGVATIIEMVAHTRLDCVIGSTGLMRHALTLARHHVEHRAAFGKRLIEQPLMRAVLAELAVEWEVSALLMLRLAEAFDRRERNPAEQAFARLGAAVAKFWICKRAPAMINEALECLGGAGYVEESGMARLYREAPLLSIWEGSGNVIALDILRGLKKEPEGIEALRAEIRAGGVPTDALDTMLAHGVAEGEARRFGELLATALQSSLAERYAPEPVAAAVRGPRGLVFGTLPRNCNVDGILERSSVAAVR